jgi:hypothetical protein
MGRTPIRYPDKDITLYSFPLGVLQEFLIERFLMRQCAHKYMYVSSFFHRVFTKRHWRYKYADSISPKLSH